MKPPVYLDYNGIAHHISTDRSGEITPWIIIECGSFMHLYNPERITRVIQDGVVTCLECLANTPRT